MNEEDEDEGAELVVEAAEAAAAEAVDRSYDDVK